MSTTSYPAKGLGGFDISEWSAYFAGDNGIIDDYSGTAFSMTRVDASNLAQIGVGKVRVGGYVLEVTATHDLTVSTTAATYYIWACYDPALNVEAGGGLASAAGPCTLGISSGAPSTSGGKVYVLLYQIVRSASQALTAATVNDFRIWTGPTLHVPDSQALASGIFTDPETAITGFSYPVGARLVQGAGIEYTHVKSTSGLKWDGGGWTTLSPQPTLGSGFTDRISFGGSFKYRWLAKNYVWLRGQVNNNVDRVANSAGNLSPDVSIATGFPTFLRPTDTTYGHVITMYRNGVQSWWGRMESTGELLLTHLNVPSETIVSGLTVEINGAYILD